jgi:SAM-dependent methyltransferase
MRKPNFFDTLAARQNAPAFTEGWQEFPWNHPRLSPRILDVHLDPLTEQASRPPDRIAAESAFLDGALNDALGRPARVCDLTCGPGLYSMNLAARAHEVVGVDYAPAVIDYARRQAAARGVAATFIQADARTVEFPPRRFDATLMIYAQPNSFPTPVLQTLLRKIRRWTSPDGLLVLEFVARCELRSDVGRTWEIREESFLHDGPHLWLEDKRFLPDRRMQVHRIFIIDEKGRLAAEYGICLMAYELPEVELLLRECGWRLEAAFGNLLGETYREGRSEWLAVVARPAAGTDDHRT